MYIEIASDHSAFLELGQVIQGHEFHYFDSTDLGVDCKATKQVTGRSYECIHSRFDSWWGFPNLYYPSNPAFVSNFVQCAR